MEQKQPLPDDDEWLTLEQACKLLNISKYTLYRLRRKGIIRDSFLGTRPPPNGPSAAWKLVRISRREIRRVTEAGLIPEESILD